MLNETLTPTQEIEVKNDFKISTNIVATVSGFNYSQKFDENKKEFIEDKTSFQIQSLVINPKNDLVVKRTLKVNKEVREEELIKMIGRTYKFSDIKEYAQKNGDFTTYTYSATKFKELTGIPKDSEAQYDVIKTIEGKIFNVADVSTEKGIATKLQIQVKNGYRMDVKDIKVKDISFDELTRFKNKTIKVNVSIVKVNGKTYISTTETPTIA